MDTDRKKLIVELEDKLGYSFRNISLLNQALTHKSYINENPSERKKDNERLEFFGDAVLSLVISDYYFHKLPESNEGHLSKIRSSIVNENSLAKIAKEMEIGKYLLLGKGEEMTGGRDKNSLMANSFEAIVAAIYIDSGYERTYSTVVFLLKDKMEGLKDNSGLYKDYKSELQELIQNRKNKIPNYRLAGEYGPDHEKIFEVEVVIEEKVCGNGRGRSKKEAEQLGAKDVLENLKKEDEQKMKEEKASTEDKEDD